MIVTKLATYSALAFTYLQFQIQVCF